MWKEPLWQASAACDGAARLLHQPQSLALAGAVGRRALAGCTRLQSPENQKVCDLDHATRTALCLVAFLSVPAPPSITQWLTTGCMTAGPFLGWVYMRKASDGTSKFMPLTEALIWAAVIAAISYMVVPRVLDSRKQKAEAEVSLLHGRVWRMA